MMVMKATLLIAMSFVLPATIAFAPRSPQLWSTSSTTATTTTVSLNAASTLPEGLLKTISKPGSGPLLRRGDVATVKYSVYLPNQPPFSRAASQKVVVSDANMIAGWESVISTMMVGERAIVRIPSTMAYGSAGVPPLIPPNADVELDLEILDSAAPVQMDFDALGYAEPNTPVSWCEFCVGIYVSCMIHAVILYFMRFAGVLRGMNILWLALQVIEAFPIQTISN